ncbi:protein-methionine-sulfoxide reductase catalytic subunit MsrP [Enterovibrio sp. ZSDZ42]|uniref:Protein-methionine-sulfoxide reductase catalytic subunit MsrP n=1 Tax=Enterovibrio gelatinilyticus TaxID=2899819 RepID=A0ABT5QW83_9GAMM|nr:protein-methionine-sulfoxide reductase catalytic subunit MsrP [Enterovibrio sp. ZSDZ42]MDD1792293.1 protein-methionine-sulfoxide reductase catalytic subunit MsrP [Enterovibrio sp. ZSDZ42]
MLIRVPKKSEIKEHELTPESVYHSRRDILKKLGIVTATLPFAAQSQANIFDIFGGDDEKKADVIFERSALTAKPSIYGADLPLTPEKKVLTYNNFYEFGTGKNDPVENSQSFSVDPWKLEVTGLVNNPISLTYDDLLKRFTLEERLYRMRCVEAWSMNIPWIGFSLGDLIRAADPLGSAKYVAFETLYDPKQMPGQASQFVGGGIDYPYVEGLRLDEAMNDLTLLSVGLYGQTLAPQNGAPVRLVVPWKYGFKSIKSIVKIHLLESQPATTWNLLARHEYGFYANVNPQVDHPRWSQGSERFIGEGSIFSSRRQPSTMFNGYQDEVASLYKGMDLRSNY